MTGRLFRKYPLFNCFFACEQCEMNFLLYLFFFYYLEYVGSIPIPFIRNPVLVENTEQFSFNLNIF